MGTFSEIGDYFNVSTTEKPVPGALAAWQRVQEGMNEIELTVALLFDKKYTADQIEPVQRPKANYVRINRAIIAGSAAGDSQALTHIHRLHCLVRCLETVAGLFLLTQTQQHVLWRRWHDQLSHDEMLAGIATEEHDGTFQVSECMRMQHH